MVNTFSLFTSLDESVVTLSRGRTVSPYTLSSPRLGKMSDR